MLYVCLLTIYKIYFYIDVIQSCIMSYIYIIIIIIKFYLNTFKHKINVNKGVYTFITNM